MLIHSFTYNSKLPFCEVHHSLSVSHFHRGFPERELIEIPKAQRHHYYFNGTSTSASFTFFDTYECLRFLPACNVVNTGIQIQANFYPDELPFDFTLERYVTASKITAFDLSRAVETYVIQREADKIASIAANALDNKYRFQKFYQIGQEGVDRDTHEGSWEYILFNLAPVEIADTKYLDVLLEMEKKLLKTKKFHTVKAIHGRIYGYWKIDKKEYSTLIKKYGKD